MAKRDPIKKASKSRAQCCVNEIEEKIVFGLMLRLDWKLNILIPCQNTEAKTSKYVSMSL